MDNLNANFSGCRVFLVSDLEDACLSLTFTCVVTLVWHTVKKTSSSKLKSLDECNCSGPDLPCKFRVLILFLFFRSLLSFLSSSLSFLTWSKWFWWCIVLYILPFASYTQVPIQLGTWYFLSSAIESIFSSRNSLGTSEWVHDTL